MVMYPHGQGAAQQRMSKGHLQGWLGAVGVIDAPSVGYEAKVLYVLQQILHDSAGSVTHAADEQAPHNPI